MAEPAKEQTQIAPYMGAILEAKRKFNEININHLVNYDKEAMFAMQAIKANSYLMKIANTNPATLRDAVINIASIGLSLNPAEKLAYLVPYKGKAVLQISYIGLTRLATDTGSIEWARAELVYSNDKLTYQGATKEALLEVPSPFDRGELRGVYCTAKTSSGDYLSGIMSVEECYEIRNRSEAYQKNAGPWVTDEGEMIKKTIIKRESKTWPKSNKNNRLDNAIEITNESEGINFNTEIDLQKVEAAYIKAIELLDTDNPDQTFEEARKIFPSLNVEEQLMLNSKLRNYKPGTRHYGNLFKELCDHVPEAQPKGDL